MNSFPLLMACFAALGLSGCFGPHREETHARIFKAPAPSIFTGRYRLVYQHMDRDLPEATAFPRSFLLLRADGTYTADRYPIFVNPPREHRTFARLADYHGHWRINKPGSAYNHDAGGRQDYWSIAVDPAPGGLRRADGFEDLIVDSFINKKTGLVEYIHFYTGDFDAGDVLTFERVPTSERKHTQTTPF